VYEIIRERKKETNREEEERGEVDALLSTDNLIGFACTRDTESEITAINRKRRGDREAA